MGVLYYSTRGDKQAYTASQAILQGLAKDGGLFVPDALPKLDKTMEELSAMDYKEVAYEAVFDRLYKRGIKDLYQKCL
mgnify:CR=1 FL=1